jgi:hypothetical protein
MHGCAPGSGGPRGAAHGNFKHGRRAIETQQLSRTMRELAKAGELLVSVALTKAGKKPPRPYRRRRHVVRAIAELKKAKAKGKGDSE